MLWEDWVASIAPSLNVTTSQAAIILAFVFTFAFVIMSIIGSPDHADKGAPIAAGFGILLFTYAEWFPRWTGTAMAFLCAALLLKTFMGGK